MGVRVPVGVTRVRWGPALVVVACLVAGAGAPVAGARSPIPALNSVRTTPGSGRVALTFDDGPNPIWTPVILDILDEYGVRATFFVNGFRVEAYPEVAAEVVRRGHSLQNHGYGHRRVSELSDAGVRREIVLGAVSIFEATGTMPACFRPGWGLSSARIRRVTAEAGESVVLWTIDSHDYAHQSAQGSIEAVLRDLHDGDVILMHDSIGWAARDALPVIIEAVRAAGLEFDTLCDDHWRLALAGPRSVSWGRLAVSTE